MVFRGNPAVACKHYPAPLHGHPFFSTSNLDRSVIFIYGNGIICYVVVFFSIIGYVASCFIHKTTISDSSLKIGFNIFLQTAKIIGYAKLAFKSEFYCFILQENFIKHLKISLILQNF